MSRSGSPWLLGPKRHAPATLRLFCFPHAGAGGSAFRGWAQRLPASVQPIAIELPGRESRIREAPLVEMRSVLDALARIVVESGPSPFAFFGHSLGALIAFELTRALRRTGAPLPAALIVSGCTAPHLRGQHRRLSLLPDGEFLDALRQFNGLPRELLELPELLDLVLPTLRADFQLLDSYVYEDDRPLPCPLVAYGGLADATVADIDLWQEHAAGPFTARRFPGDHFYLHSADSDFFARLCADLETLAHP